jgi:predicted permease
VSDVLEVLIQNILPIFLVAAIGYWLRRGMGLDKGPLSSVVFNALSPALAFSLLVNTQLAAGELLKLALFAFLTIAAMGVVGWAAGRLLGYSRLEIAALMLVLMFTNGGNYGMTLNQLRFGDEGLARAVVYYVMSTIMVFSAGVLIASSGHRGWREALARLVRVPAIYAVALALLVYGLDIAIPAPLMRAVEVAGQGALPVMLVVLGMQLADLRQVKAARLAVPAAIIRMAGGPLVAILFAGLLGLQGLSRATAIIEASMPTAVIVTILASEFDLVPEAVTSVVVLSTLLSPLTLALVIAWLT